MRLRSPDEGRLKSCRLRIKSRIRSLSLMAISRRRRSSSSSTARRLKPLSTVMIPCSGLLNSWAMDADSLPMAESFSACRYCFCVSCNSRERFSTRRSRSMLIASSCFSARISSLMSRAVA